MDANVVYQGRNNAPVLHFTDDGIDYSLENATKIEIRLAGQSFNTIDDADKFDVAEFAQGKLALKFGGLDISDGHHPLTVIFFDAANPDGFVWVNEDDIEKVGIWYRRND